MISYFEVITNTWHSLPSTFFLQYRKILFVFSLLVLSSIQATHVQYIKSCSCELLSTLTKTKDLYYETIALCILYLLYYLEQWNMSLKFLSLIDSL